MKKKYKLILIVYVMFCLFVIIYSLIPRNPVRNYYQNIYAEKIDLIEGLDKSNIYNNYEMNFMYENNINNDDYIEGRRVEYYNVYDQIITLDKKYIRENLVGEEKLKVYYFNQSNYLLVKAIIPFRTYIESEYYFNLKSFHIVDTNISYDYKNEDYKLIGIENSFNGLLTLTNKPKANDAIVSSNVTVSFFIKVEELNKNVLIELYRKDKIENKSIILGLNEIKEQISYYPINVITNYLELGGN